MFGLYDSYGLCLFRDYNLEKVGTRHARISSCHDGDVDGKKKDSDEYVLETEFAGCEWLPPDTISIVAACCD